MAKRLRANDEELAVALATLGISRRSSNVRFWG
jgi:hypothetical protein